MATLTSKALNSTLDKLMKVAPRVYGGYQNQSNNHWLHGMEMDRFRFMARSRCKSFGRLNFLFSLLLTTNRPTNHLPAPYDRPAFYVFLLAGCKWRFYLFCHCYCYCFNNNVIVVVAIDFFFYLLKPISIFCCCFLNLNIDNMSWTLKTVNIDSSKIS